MTTDVSTSTETTRTMNDVIDEKFDETDKKLDDQIERLSDDISIDESIDASYKIQQLTVKTSMVLNSMSAMFNLEQKAANKIEPPRG